MKKLISLILIAISAAGVAMGAPGGDWKMHPTFGWLINAPAGVSNDVVKVIDTPEKAYFQVFSQPYAAGKSTGYETFVNYYSSLFEYDKEADELIALTRRNALSENNVRFAAYNADRKYLLVVYGNGNIDFIFDNGKRYNVPALVSMSFPSGKGVNSATFDSANDQVWLATDFGYLVLNDKKFEVSSSGNYGAPLQGIAHIGGKIVIIDGKSIKSVDDTDRRPSLSSFKALGDQSAAGKDVSGIYPLDGGKALIVASDGVRLADLSGSDIVVEKKLSGVKYNTVEQNRDGYILSGDNNIGQATRGGDFAEVTAQDDLKKVRSGSWDFKEFWFAGNRSGIESRSCADNVWSVTRGSMRPNSPAVFRSNAMAYSPKYGVLVQDHGVKRSFLANNVDYPSHISAYKGGEWSDLSIVRSDAALIYGMTRPSGLAIDPNNPDHYYSGSWTRGLVRGNLADPKDIVRLVGTASISAVGAVDHAVLPSTRHRALWPDFDAKGNLWFLHWHSDADVPKIIGVTAEKLKAGDYSNPVGLCVPEQGMDYDAVLTALKTSANSGYLVVSNGPYGAPLLIYNTAKTPEDTSDDSYFLMGHLSDQDGSAVEIPHIHAIWEDPETSLVWVAGDNGVFHFNPRQALANRSNRVTRVKVSRNDGTNLADYLLAGVTVYGITSDAAGRKYFATGGGGIVMTSADGREILGQFSSENSYLPSDVVYSVIYSPESRSVICSTADGICEYFPSGSVAADDSSDLHIYPNPVRPDYYGWITIEGLESGSIVKIVDASGSLVKELGPVSGGTAQWDGTNMDLKRVRSGVYHVFASQTEQGGATKTGKILVVN